MSSTRLTKLPRCVKQRVGLPRGPIARANMLRRVAYEADGAHAMHNVHLPILLALTAVQRGAAYGAKGGTRQDTGQFALYALGVTQVHLPHLLALTAVHRAAAHGAKVGTRQDTGRPARYAFGVIQVHLPLLPAARAVHLAAAHGAKGGKR